jgi:hypothetical protein
MAVTSGIDEKNIERYTSIRSPSATINNNTRLNSAFNSNSATIPTHQADLHNKQESQMSFLEQQRDSQTSSKQTFIQNSTLKRTNSKITPTTKKNDRKNNFRLAPTTTVVTNDTDKNVGQQIHIQKCFRPSAIIKQSSQLNLKKTTNQQQQHQRTVSSLNNQKYENDSFVSKTVATNDEESEPNNNNDNALITSVDNLSNLNDDSNFKNYPSLIRSKYSLLTTAHEKHNTHTNPSNSIMSLKRSKSNLVNDILQTQTNFLSSTSLSRSPSMHISKGLVNESVIDSISETEFVKLLKQYRQTKDPQLLNQLATPARMTPVSGINNASGNQTPNNFVSNEAMQELRMPKTSNILFYGKPNHTSLTRYYNSGESMTRTSLQQATTTVPDLDCSQIVPITTAIKRTSSGRMQEPTFFVNYINNKYRVRKYDKLMMSYLLSNEQVKQTNHYGISKQSSRQMSASSVVFNPIFNLQTSI